MMITNFKLLIDLHHVSVLLNNKGELVCLGLCFPSISEAVRRSDGHLTPAALFRILKAMKKPRILDFGLVGVDPDYANRGIGAIASYQIMRMLRDEGVEYAETNLNLEDNHAIQNMWKRFRRVIHKKRRAYIKRLEV